MLYNTQNHLEFMFLFNDAFNSLYSSKSVLIKIINRIIEENEKWKHISKLNFADYKQYFENKIETAKIYGQHGYVISPFMCMDDEKKIQDIILKDKSEKAIVKCIYRNNEIVWQTIYRLQECYKDSPNIKFYFDCFTKKYKGRDYSSAAFYISSVLDNRIKSVFKIGELNKLTKIIKEGISLTQESFFEKLPYEEKGRISNAFLITEYLPSFHEFILRTFTENKDEFGKLEFEPKHFNRNWFVHGYVTHQIERYQVLQLLNALSSLEFISKAIRNV